MYEGFFGNAAGRQAWVSVGGHTHSKHVATPVCDSMELTLFIPPTPTTTLRRWYDYDAGEIGNEAYSVCIGVC